MIHCAHCLTKEPPHDGCCPVCGIARDRMRRDLSPDENRVRFYARIIRVLAMLHLIGAGIGIIISFCHPVPIAATAVLAVINIVLAFGLSSYLFWAYKAATVYYFLIGMVNIVSVNIPGVLVILLLLYAVGNRTAKSIFERRL